MDSSLVHTISLPHEQEEWGILALFLSFSGCLSGKSECDDLMHKFMKLHFVEHIDQKRREHLLGTAWCTAITIKAAGAEPVQSKQRFKQKLKEADTSIGGAGRENKVENLKELVGGGKASPNMSKGSPRDWLDPHCDESQFEKSYPR
ncbi:NAD-dependent deacetylase sirtuin-6 [Hibiscus syriacus]|uniref:NAD-dependent deacetylase sirtuin-6 n=1 Tax=Hibiscus syriacus TaxID=106335 RepID=A0A6A2XMG9_HIBSY|nr:NAD-dependent deacetylase sirtuin-6 [Hibiscus syriacus]